MLGALHPDSMTISEVRRFQNVPVHDKESLQWNIPQLYQETIEGLRAVGAYEEAVEAISCDSWAGDYLLFDSDNSLIAPAYHHRDPRTREGMQKVLSQVSRDVLYQETGVQPMPGNTVFQLGAEKWRRLSRAERLLPVADAFNYLLSGVPCIEMSMTGAMQLCNSLTHAWCPRLLEVLDLPAKLLPAPVSAGTELGPLRPEVAKLINLEDARVVATCSDRTAAELAGLPIVPGESWAYLRLGSWTSVGTELAQPIVTNGSRDMGFTNEPDYGGSVRFSKQTVGLWILEECRRFWKAQDREIDDALLTHLAGSAPAFESLINPADPRFLTPGDMPLKIQAYCRDTGQPVPRKPGPLIRCILESLALFYRQTFQEIEDTTGRQIGRVYLIGGSTDFLFNHFIANAVRRPLVLVSSDAAAIGNIVVQAVALGHFKSLEEGREVVRRSCKTETLLPYATAWDAAYVRLKELRAA